MNDWQLVAYRVAAATPSAVVGMVNDPAGMLVAGFVLVWVLL